MILELVTAGVLAQIRKAVKKAVGQKKAQELLEAAKNFVGVTHATDSANLKLTLLLKELEQLEKQLARIEQAMEWALANTGWKEIILSIGIGIVSAANFLGNIGDPLRFNHPLQISNMAVYNLVEDSSGQNKSRTTISKRGRKNLRNVLYQIVRTILAVNAEIKKFYQKLKTRPCNPLKKKQALVVISKKIITIIHSLLKKQTGYQAELVFNQFRKKQMKQVA